MEAGRKLDALVAEKVMGKPFRKPTHGACCTCQVCGWDYDNCQCGYGEFIDKAWRVVEKMEEMGYSILAHNVIPNSDAVVWRVKFSQLETITEFTAPLAICLAALKAKGVE